MYICGYVYVTLDDKLPSLQKGILTNTFTQTNQANTHIQSINALQAPPARLNRDAAFVLDGLGELDVPVPDGLPVPVPLLPDVRRSTQISPVASELINTLPSSSRTRPVGRKQLSGQAARLGLVMMSTAASRLSGAATGEPSAKAMEETL
jgi:hypothetical protein